VFAYCYALTSITLPNIITSIGNNWFCNWSGLTSITIPGSVTELVVGAFTGCYSVGFYDFTHHTFVPTLNNTGVFNDIAADCEIRVPAALVDEWKAAANWSTYASKIVGV
jgi:hypothetical protein